MKVKEEAKIKQILDINFSESFYINIDKKLFHNLLVLYYLKQ